MQIFYIFPQQYRHFESIVRFDFVVHTIYISDPLVYSCSASSSHHWLKTDILPQ